MPLTRRELCSMFPVALISPMMPLAAQKLLDGAQAVFGSQTVIRISKPAPKRVSDAPIVSKPHAA